MSNLIDIWRFKSTPNIYADVKGNFFFNNHRPIKKEYYCGRIVIRVNKKRYGMKTLRKEAYKSTKTIELTPF